MAAHLRPMRKSIWYKSTSSKILFASLQRECKKTRSRRGETEADKAIKINYPDRSKGPVTDPGKAIPCAYCGTLFMPKSKISKYCSNRCAERVKNMNKIRICPSCGKEFRTTSDNTKYCDVCRSRFWVRGRRIRR